MRFDLKRLCSGHDYFGFGYFIVIASRTPPSPSLL
jgi:hypothetical protein